MNKKSQLPPSRKTHNQTFGSQGENLATEYLETKKYKILDRNYRSSAGEIDIIAEKNGVVVFVEVKTRTSDSYGEGSISVNHKKLTRMAQGATEYLHENNLRADFRFDIIAITGKKINHFQNVTMFS